MASWLQEHVRATLARQRDGAWQWQAIVFAWHMTQAAIAERCNRGYSAVTATPSLSRTLSQRLGSRQRR
jgi:hypothetical protein